MILTWTSHKPKDQSPVLLGTFESENHNFSTILLVKNNKNYLFLIYNGSVYFDINVEYKFKINEQTFQGVYQFSQFYNDLIFLLDESSHYNISLDFNIIKNYKSKEATGFCGLRNLGATCYFNSFIQPLFHIPKFRNEIYSCEPKGKLFLLQKLFYNMENQDCVDTSDFLTNVIDNVALHQDIHEFSKYFFDVIESQLKKTNIEKKDIWENLIQGHVINFINAECGCQSNIKESFQDIQVVIRDFFNNTKASKLTDSLKLFTKVETLSGENKYKCEKHGLVKAEKGILFKDCPPILFVLLKRFDMDYETGESHKIDDYFEFPKTLDFSNFCLQDVTIEKYDLFSVIVHKGVPSEGHFFSFIKIKKQWYKFNDNTVTKVTEDEAVLNNFGGKHFLTNKEKDYSAYYLVYLRKDFIIEEDILIPSRVLEEINKQYKKREIRCTTFKHIKNYKGKGFYNFDSYNFPLTGYQEYVVNEFDTVKALKNKIETEQEIYIFNIDDNKFEYLKDEDYLLYNDLKDVCKDCNDAIDNNINDKVAIDNNDKVTIDDTNINNINDINTNNNNNINTYNNNSANMKRENFFIFKKSEKIDFTKKKLIFVKIYKDNLWLPDTYPENLNLSFIAILDKNIKKTLQDKIRIVDFEIYKEDIFYNKIILLTHDDVSNINNGDIFIIVEKLHKNAFECFYKDFVNRMCINVLLDSQNCVSLFLPCNLESVNLEKRIWDFFNNQEIVVEKFKPGILEYLNLNRNMISVDIKNNKIVYLGYDDVIDYNNIKYVHPFIVSPNITFRNFYKMILTSNYVNPIKFDNLRIIDSVKNSLFLQSYSFDEEFTSQGMNIIQDFKSNYVKVAYFSGMYEIKGYPFFLFIENFTVAEFRDKYKMSGRLVKFDHEGYKDLDDIENIGEYSPETFILIERRY